jgi:RNA polymerase sigma-70 factor (ECF subfamily)
MPETAEFRDVNEFTPAPVNVSDLELHRRELTGYCQRIVGASEADDAVQETMLRAWRASADFAGRSSVRAWLYRIAANTCLDLLRGRERRGRLGQRLQASAEVSTAPVSSADPAEFAATQDGVRRALARQSGPVTIDAGQLARYQDAFRHYDIATLVGMIQVEAGQAAG